MDHTLRNRPIIGIEFRRQKISYRKKREKREKEKEKEKKKEKKERKEKKKEEKGKERGKGKRKRKKEEKKEGFFSKILPQTKATARNAEGPCGAGAQRHRAADGPERKMV